MRFFNNLLIIFFTVATSSSIFASNPSSTASSNSVTMIYVMNQTNQQLQTTASQFSFQNLDYIFPSGFTFTNTNMSGVFELYAIDFGQDSSGNTHGQMILTTTSGDQVCNFQFFTDGSLQNSTATGSNSGGSSKYSCTVSPLKWFVNRPMNVDVTITQNNNSQVKR